MQLHMRQKGMLKCILGGSLVALCICVFGLVMSLLIHAPEGFELTIFFLFLFFTGPAICMMIGLSNFSPVKRISLNTMENFIAYSGSKIGVKTKLLSDIEEIVGVDDYGTCFELRFLDGDKLRVDKKYTNYLEFCCVLPSIAQDLNIPIITEEVDERVETIRKKTIVSSMVAEKEPSALLVSSSPDNSTLRMNVRERTEIEIQYVKQ